MSLHQAFRRTAVPSQMAQSLKMVQIPAPTRGIIESENFAFMNPGAALVSDNWLPTMRGVKLRGGCIRWCELPDMDPVISGFDYVAGNIHRMFAGQETKLYDVTFSGAPTLVQGGQTSGNYASAQMANASGNYLVAVNDGGDLPLRFDGTAWSQLAGSEINGPPGTAVSAGGKLVYVWKYRSRLFFIEQDSMNAWYLPLNAIQGTLLQIPLSGAATKGGKLLFGATWSMDAGDGLDDKCVFVTDLGEVIVFTGSDPGEPEGTSPWHQEGRYQIGAPLGMNAHMQIGGDILIATVDGIVPLSAAVSKTPDQLELSMLTRNIKNMWRNEVNARRDHPWMLKSWLEYGGMFVTLPGGMPGDLRCLAANNATGAWGRITGWDALCWIYLKGNMYFGTQDGIIMQADRTGYDDGMPYVATLVGGWNPLQTGGATAVWHQARATFLSRTAGEPFIPQLSACVDYVIKVPPPPPAGADPGVLDVWDQGLWDQALWDQPSAAQPVMANTLWVSIGQTGYAHAPIVQTTIAQQAKPDVELIAIGCAHERAGVNV